jgi:pyridoxine 5-phosphate synthase
VARKIRLGVNIDHAATLRQVRGGKTSYPSLLEITHQAVLGGADQITIHLREDRRHIQESDLKILSESCPVLLNLEMACTDEMLKKALIYRPDWVCYVPEKRQELTTEGGLNVVKMKRQLGRQVDRLLAKGIESSMFIEPRIEQVKASFEIGADAIEFHTGHWVLLQGKRKEKEFQRLREASQYAASLGLGVHAGHGLDYVTAFEIREIPELEEVNIGHSIICYSLEVGIRQVVSHFKKILAGKQI